MMVRYRSEQRHRKLRAEAQAGRQVRKTRRYLCITYCAGWLFMGSAQKGVKVSDAGQSKEDGDGGRGRTNCQFILYDNECGEQQKKENKEGKAHYIATA